MTDVQTDRRAYNGSCVLSRSKCVSSEFMMLDDILFIYSVGQAPSEFARGSLNHFCFVPRMSGNSAAAALMSLRGSKGKGKASAATTDIVLAGHFQEQETRQCDCCMKVCSSRDPGSNHNKRLPFVKDMVCVYCYVYWSQMCSWMEWKAASVCVCVCVCV